jgi:hypothetical protein
MKTARRRVRDSVVFTPSKNTEEGDALSAVTVDLQKLADAIACAGVSAAEVDAAFRRLGTNITGLAENFLLTAEPEAVRALMAEARAVRPYGGASPRRKVRLATPVPVKEVAPMVRKRRVRIRHGDER